MVNKKRGSTKRSKSVIKKRTTGVVKKLIKRKKTGKLHRG